VANLNSESYHSPWSVFSRRSILDSLNTHTQIFLRLAGVMRVVIQHVIAVNWVTLTGNSDCFALLSLNVMPAFFVQELIMDSDVIATQKCHHVIWQSWKLWYRPQILQLCWTQPCSVKLQPYRNLTRIIFFCIEVISSTLPLRKQTKYATFRYDTIEVENWLKSLANNKNSIGPTIDLWGTPDVTGRPSRDCDVLGAVRKIGPQPL
jgi:hypothetical protein